MPGGVCAVSGVAQMSCHPRCSTALALSIRVCHTSDRSGSPRWRGVACAAKRIYTSGMEFTWSERKRSLNLKQHGLDFVDAPAVFGGLTFTFEDDRFSYNEQRFVTLGVLAGVPVSIVHTETAHEIRIISFRQATRREAQLFFAAVKD